jgi:large subunit ribosomal protein L47
MKRIRHVLTERYYSWEDARKLAETDPEINLVGGGKNGPVFTPSEFMIEEEDETPEIKAQEVEGEGHGERITGQAGQEEVKLNVDPSTLSNGPAAGAAGETKEAPRV